MVVFSCGFIFLFSFCFWFSKFVVDSKNIFVKCV
jgi:hypothetical protein